MSENEKICGTCAYHKRDENFEDDWMCVNDESEFCADWTQYNDRCAEWEARV